MEMILPRDKVHRARAGLVLDQPFFGSLALRLEIVEDKTCKTVWTNGVQLGYNPDFIHSLTLDETKGVLAHDVMHLACAHHARRQHRDHEQWNEAGDYAINDILLQAGFTLPDGALTGFGRDESAESIYSQLSKDKQDNGQQQPGDQGQGQGQAGDQSQAGDQPGQQYGDKPGQFGEVRDAPGQDGQPATQAELAKAEADAKVAVQQAASIAKSWGSLPAGIERLIEELMKPKVAWQDVLRRFVDQQSRNDYTWTKPSARYQAAGLYLPALYNEEMRPVAIVVDTSGSIDQATLDQIAGEVDSIIHDANTTATVIYCDSKIAGVEEFTQEDTVKLNAKGGGGTDFRPPFAEVEARQIEPACMIYLTDGDCKRFPDEPEYPVLWGKIGGYNFDPPFGEVMEIIE